MPKDAAARLMQRCRFHPLALDIAARLILKLANDGVAQPLAAIEKRVAQQIAALKAGDDERTNLFAVFQISYDDLNAGDQTRFQKLAAFAPSGFGVPAVAFVWETDEPDAETTLERFCTLSLLKHTEENAARFRFHDLLDEYASDLLKQTGQAKAARGAHAQFLIYLFAKHTLDDLSNARHVADELDNLRAACAWATQSKNRELLARLATTPRNWLYNIFRNNDEWLTWLNDAIRIGFANKQLQANTRKAIGDVQRFRDDNDAALTSYEQALGLFRAVGSRLGEANTRKAIGDVQRFRDDNDAALTSYEQALNLFREVGDRLGEASTYGSMSRLEVQRGNVANGEELLTRAVTLHQQIGSRYDVAVDYGNFAIVLYQRGDKQRARDYAKKAEPIFENIGHPAAETMRRILKG